MPIYEYQCRKCSKVTENLEGAHDRPLAKCPSCGGKVERLISPGAFILKGTGWYATDYAHKTHDSGNGNGRAKAKPPRKEESCPASAGNASPACAGCPKAK